ISRARARENGAVEARAAGDYIVAHAAIEHVVTRAAIEGVGAGQPLQIVALISRPYIRREPEYVAVEVHDVEIAAAVFSEGGLIIASSGVRADLRRTLDSLP